MTKYIIRRLNSTNDEVLIKDVALQKGDWFTFRNEANGFSFRLYKVIDDRQLSTNGFSNAMMCEKYIGNYDNRKHEFVIKKEGRETLKYNDYVKNNVVRFNSSDEALKWLGRQVNIMNTNEYFDSLDANIDFAYLLSEERKAVEDYRKAIASTTDKNQLYVLSHILKEEAHHIELLENLQKGKVEFKDAAPGVDIKKYEALIDEYAYKKPGKEDLQDIVDRFKLNRQTMAQMLVFWGYLDMWNKLKYYE